MDLTDFYLRRISELEADNKWLHEALEQALDAMEKKKL